MKKYESFYLRGHGLFKLSRLLDVEHEITSRDKLQHKVEMRLKTDLKIKKPFTEISLGYSSNFTLVLKYPGLVFLNWINNKTHIALEAGVELDEERRL